MWARDSRLIERNVKEEIINHRLARYLEDELANTINCDLEVDLEYNSDGEKKKKIRIRNRYGNIRPDIILHERETNKKNFLAIEIKINNSSVHDFNKLIGLIKSKYNYKYGAAISLQPGKEYFKVVFFYSRAGYVWRQDIHFWK